MIFYKGEESLLSTASKNRVVAIIGTLKLSSHGHELAHLYFFRARIGAAQT